MGQVRLCAGSQSGMLSKADSGYVKSFGHAAKRLTHKEKMAWKLVSDTVFPGGRHARPVVVAGLKQSGQQPADPGYARPGVGNATRIAPKHADDFNLGNPLNLRQDEPTDHRDRGQCVDDSTCLTRRNNPRKYWPFRSWAALTAACGSDISMSP